MKIFLLAAMFASLSCAAAAPRSSFWRLTPQDLNSGYVEVYRVQKGPKIVESLGERGHSRAIWTADLTDCPLTPRQAAEALAALQHAHRLPGAQPAGLTSLAPRIGFVTKAAPSRPILVVTGADIKGHDRSRDIIQIDGRIYAQLSGEDVTVIGRLIDASDCHA